MSSAHLAIDLGASSGRALVGTLGGDSPRLTVDEVHRFEHHPTSLPTGPVWDLTGIWRNILIGLQKSADWCREHGAELQSVGVDTWGVDWALVGASGELVCLPHAYRDPRNEEACRRTLERLGGFEKLYERTGIQMLPFNTLFQLVARFEADPALVNASHRLLMLPDLMHYWLSGEMLSELSAASSTAMLRVEDGQWDLELVEQLGLPTHILGPLVEPGTQVGVLREELARDAGLDRAPKVIAPAAHDTGSAVAAVPVSADGKGATPARREDVTWAYLSSGTWSCLGAELSQPHVTPEACRISYTHERGVAGTIRYLKNLGGLWMVQELRREFLAAGNDYSFAELAEMAAQATPFRTIVNPSHSEFVFPGDMANKIRAFARDTEQPPPEAPAQLVRCCLESLALCYAHSLDLLAGLLDCQFETLHIIGGGSKNQLLNQLTTNAVGLPVLCGPAEATAIGNLLVQAMGYGTVSGVGDARQIVARSFPPQRFEPDATAPGREEARARFLEILPAEA